MTATWSKKLPPQNAQGFIPEINRLGEPDNFQGECKRYLLDIPRLLLRADHFCIAFLFVL
jgi:hypothetical protein